MKITKFQNPAGKLIRVLGNALEQQLSKTGTKIFAGTQKRYPQILDDIMKSYGDVELNVEQADALSDFVKYAVTKDKINLTFNPQTKRFSWQEIPFNEASETWKHLPVMQENPTIKFEFTEHRQQFKVPYMRGILEWLQNINVKNPDLGVSYLDMFAQKPLYFQKMFAPDGTMIK